MPSKSKEELAEEYRDGLVDIGNSTVTERDYLAGYAAGLESPEVKGLIEALACAKDNLLFIKNRGMQPHEKTPAHLKCYVDILTEAAADALKEIESIEKET